VKMNSSNRLTALAADIQAAHREIQASAESMAERAIAAGNMLIEAKSALPHGKWNEWLTHHVGMSDRSARRYMQIARSGMKTATVADLGIRAAAEAIAKVSSAGASPEDDAVGQAWLIEMLALWHCMIFSWARLPPKDRARVRMNNIVTFASSPAHLPLVPLYIQKTDEMERLLSSKEFDPFDMPVGDELIAYAKQAAAEIVAEGRA
jgi:hypothetical protein